MLLWCLVKAEQIPMTAAGKVERNNCFIPRFVVIHSPISDVSGPTKKAKSRTSVRCDVEFVKTYICELRNFHMLWPCLYSNIRTETT